MLIKKRSSKRRLFWRMTTVAMVRPGRSGMTVDSLWSGIAEHSTPVSQLASAARNLLRSTVMDASGKVARSPHSAGEAALLTSRDNRWLKEFRMALRGGVPTENGFVGVEGVRLVEEALRSGCRIQAVLFSESGERHHARLSSFIDRPELAFPVLHTTDRLFEGL